MWLASIISNWVASFHIGRIRSQTPPSTSRPFSRRVLVNPMRPSPAAKVLVKIAQCSRARPETLGQVKNYADE